MKKALRSQLLAAVSMLVVAAIALTGATYAWFTTVANPTVGNIDLYVKASDALYLSELLAPVATNPSHWQVDVTQGEIVAAQPAASLNPFPAEIFNVSSAFNTASNGFYTAAFNTAGAITGYTESPAADLQRQYVKFSLWAKSSSAGMVTLENIAGETPASTVVAIDEVGGTPIGYPANVLAGIAYTVRVGIVPRTGATENWDDAVIWEPNSTAHLQAPHRGDAPAAAKETVLAITGEEIEDAAAQTTYDFQEDDTNVKNFPIDGAAWPSETPGTKVDGKIQLFYLSADAPKQFNVYIWVEGADADTINVVAKAYFRTFLRFGLIKRA